MYVTLPVRVSGFLAAALLCTVPVLGYHKESRVPLFGCHEYFNASGSARYEAKRNEQHVARSEVLTIDIKNVPLKPGTVLVVYIDNEQMGKITLDARQSARFVISNETHRHVPIISAGSIVMIKKPTGQIVMW